LLVKKIYKSKSNNKIIDIDYKNRCVVAQPGVTNLSITKAVENKGFYYAPDPSMP